MRKKKKPFKYTINFNKFVIVLVLFMLPFTLFLSRSRQETRSHAAAATTMFFVPSNGLTYPIGPGKTFSLDLMIDPSDGTNAITYVRYAIQYNPAQLTPGSPPAVINSAAFTQLEGPLISNNVILGTQTAGTGPFLNSSSIRTRVKVATFTFTMVSGAPITQPSEITRLPITFTSRSLVNSAAGGDASNENVFVNTSTPIYPTLPPANTPPQPTVASGPGSGSTGGNGNAKSPCPMDQVLTDFGCVPNTPLGFAMKFYDIGLGILGGITLITIIYGGYLILTSRGNTEQLNKGRAYIVYSVGGLLLAIFGYVLIQVITKDILHLPGFS